MGLPPIPASCPNAERSLVDSRSNFCYHEAVREARLSPSLDHQALISTPLSSIESHSSFEPVISAVQMWFCSRRVNPANHKSCAAEPIHGSIASHLLAHGRLYRGLFCCGASLRVNLSSYSPRVVLRRIYAGKFPLKEKTINMFFSKPSLFSKPLSFFRPL